MQVNKINNNNINFKAKVEVKIGEDLLFHLRNLAPERCVKFAEETVEAVNILKKVASSIGTNDDIIMLNSWKGKELDLTYNGHFEGVVCDSDLPGNVHEEMIFTLKNFAGKYDPNNKIILGLNKLLSDNPLSNYTFIFNKKSSKVLKMPIIQSNPKNLEAPETLNIEDCLEKVRKLNTVA